jgi:hypothetical protein
MHSQRLPGLAAPHSRSAASHQPAPAPLYKPAASWPGQWTHSVFQASQPLIPLQPPPSIPTQLPLQPAASWPGAVDSQRVPGLAALHAWHVDAEGPHLTPGLAVVRGYVGRAILHPEALELCGTVPQAQAKRPEPTARALFGSSALPYTAALAGCATSNGWACCTLYARLRPKGRACASKQRSSPAAPALQGEPSTLLRS